MIAAQQSNLLTAALQRHLDALESQTKTSSLNGDMLAVAKAVYEMFQSLMKQEKGFDPSLVNLVLNSTKVSFYSPFGIAADLEKWLQNPIALEAKNYAWYDLCTHQT